MSAAFELAVVSYILIQMQLMHANQYTAGSVSWVIFNSLQALCYVCWVALIVQAVRAVIR